MAGVRLGPGQRAVFFGRSVPAGEDAVVVTVSGSSAALPGTEPGSVKVTPFAEYPAKGRGTGGVRCHRFLRGEDVLIAGLGGPGPGPGGSRHRGRRWTCRPATGRRDGSGTPRPASRWPAG